MSLLPYDLLDEFTVHEEAERYNEEFYQKLLKEKREQYHREDLTFEDGDIFSDFYTGAAVKFLSEVPPCVGVADYRVFLLKVMSPSVWKYFEEEARKQEKREKLLYDTLKKREKEDRLKMPKHWLPLFDLAWVDGCFFLHTLADNKITATVRDEFGQEMDLTFLRAECFLQKEEEIPTRILFTEVLWENGKLRLNILTHTNEYSILAEDVMCVWTDME